MSHFMYEAQDFNIPFVLTVRTPLRLIFKDDRLGVKITDKKRKETPPSSIPVFREQEVSSVL